MQYVPVGMPSRSVDVERRRHRRIQVLLVVELRSDELSQVVRVTELSQQGARLQLARPVDAGSLVTVSRGSVTSQATVAWTRGNVAGIRFMKPMDENSFLRLRRGA